ncbi:hypothetical protein QAD02_006825 [Eretmocerus hayati]|uniref:Uncharacterized protein n=1 Tax=Eretmocerus hayati TaxID=131215 RepID=A0ACC2N345_9HYME|nr:hypothetical protein QAD02_006825 [Eretmocerus hayati]
MSKATCCVVNCSNSGRNSKCLFFKFPISESKREQRRLWIAAVKRKNVDGSPWMPKPHDRICSAHYFDNDKSDDPQSPSYVPTVFPPVYPTKKIDSKAAARRFKRLKDRSHTNVLKLATLSLQSSSSIMCSTSSHEDSTQVAQDPHSVEMLEMKLTVDQECQVSFDVNEPQVPSSSFFVYRCDQGSHSNVEIQTDIIINQKVTNDQGVGTDSSEPIQTEVELGFKGTQSISQEKQLLDLAGVSTDTFNTLLGRTKHLLDNKWKVKRQDRLLLFLMKLKTGLTFSALSALFLIDRKTVSRIFFQMLEHLVYSTKDFISWPSRDVVQDTMPKCFKDKYSSTRVIIDCTEFRMDIPSQIDERVWCYSHYKHGFTIKLLVCITPGGYICFRSKAAGGRMSDSQLTIDSGLLDLLEEGDVVLADKGFPEIKTVVDASGKKVLVVMPLFFVIKRNLLKKKLKKLTTLQALESM